MNTTNQIAFDATLKVAATKEYVEQQRKLQEIRDLEIETIVAAKEYAMAVNLGQTDGLFELNTKADNLKNRLSIKHL